MSLLLFIAGICVGFLAKYLWDTKQDKNLQFKWWQYLLMICWTLWVGFGIIFVVLSLAEYESRAAGLAALIFGGVAIIGFVVLRALYLRQNSIPAENKKSSTIA
ncbi:MAG: hypothetical protein WCR27_10455 [Eubacteriales bacterium]